jgi:hypothetical protein
MDLFGFAECCGIPPEQDVEGTALGVKCPKCGKNAAVYGGPMFLRSYWNRRCSGPRPADGDRKGMRGVAAPRLVGLPAGWRSAALDIEFVGYGHSQKMRDLESAVFLSPESTETLLMGRDPQEVYECAVGKHRELHDLEIIATNPDNRLRLQWPERKRYPYSYAYASRGYCTDGTWWFLLCLRPWTAKHKDDILRWLSKETR